MPTNGAHQKITLTLTLDPETNQIRMSAPESLEVAYSMLRSGLDMTFKRAANPGAERKVKTLDELGMSPGSRKA